MTLIEHGTTTTSNHHAIHEASHPTETPDAPPPATDNRTPDPSLAACDPTPLQRLKNWHPPMRNPSCPGWQDTARALPGAAPC